MAIPSAFDPGFVEFRSASDFDECFRGDENLGRQEIRKAGNLVSTISNIIPALLISCLPHFVPGNRVIRG
jgi:hypothetical protein